MIKDEHNTKLINYLTELKETGNYTNLIITGAVGVGKTYLVKEIMQADYFMDEPHFKQLLVSQGLGLRPSNEYANGFRGYPIELLANSKKIETVIYDDLGAVDVSSAYLEKMQYWIDRRNNRKAKTIFTTNLTQDQIFKRDQRLASRIFENAKIVSLGGSDRRMNKAQVINL